MNIAYFLEDTELAGGIRVAVAQADALIDRGHDVTIITKGGQLEWRRSRAKWIRVRAFEEADVRAFDFIIGTFWKTLAATYAIAGRRAIHLCQGYEGSFTAYQPLRDEIDRAYRLPIPKITVSPHLVEICRRFYDDATWIGQIVDEEFYQATAPRVGRRRVLLVGPAQADFKGIDIGYAAVREARARGAVFDLIRVSQWPAAEDEPTELAGEFHVALNTAEMARLIASCDINLGPSRSQEGFGLPSAEAMASGVPTVLTEIPSFLSWDRTKDFALFVPPDDASAMAGSLIRLIGEPALGSSIASRGREVAEQFRAARTGERLERYFRDRL